MTNNIDILVNKEHPINDYIPPNLIELPTTIADKNKYLDKTAYLNIFNLINAAKKQNLTIRIVSAYRSYDYQEEIFARYTDEVGHSKASQSSAWPGYSEHQTGLAVDLADDTKNYHNFINTNEFQWIKKNAHKYGYILRYPKDKTNITGYIYEPWHFRYVGTELANYLYNNNLTLEEYKKEVK